ncbi:MAG: putative acetyltransferase, superfamily [Ramlibacter sp.]|nr:putative acetyltransferase, superfamily [Ramlibacter sp.]
MDLLAAREMIRDAAPADFADIVRINVESEHFLSPLPLERLRLLHSQAAYHRVADSGDGVGAFLLAFREGAAYDSPNYRWFASRYPQFLYIDRVVVSPASQARRWGTLLYEDLFAFARTTGVARVTCEYDVEPPNSVSARFHQKFKFTEVGRQTYGAGNKVVSLQEVSP